MNFEVIVLKVVGIGQIRTESQSHAGAQHASQMTKSEPKGFGGRRAVEYCGRICKTCVNGKDKFYYTGPVRGIDDQGELDEISEQWSKILGANFKASGGCEPTDADECDDNDAFVAEYHSHPGRSGPSRGDKHRAKKTGRPDYVGRGKGLLGKGKTDRGNPDGTIDKIREPIPSPTLSTP